LTKAEITKRETEEVKASGDKIKPPGFLTKKKQKEEFTRISNELVDAGIMSNLDCDELGRYIITAEDFIFYSKAVEKSRRQDPIDFDALKSFEWLKSKAFSQCQSCASALGLNISSRCKLVVPKKEEPKANKFDKFGKAGTA